MLLDPDQSRAVLERALDRNFALLAVNADSPAAVADVLEAARLCQAPVIIEASLWQLKGRSFGAGDALCGLTRFLADLAVLAESAAFRQVPVLFHTDHIKGPETRALLQNAIAGVPVRGVEGAIALAASTVSLDSSELSEDENLRLCGALCQHAAAHDRPLTLEMEAGVDDGLTPLETASRLVGGLEAAHPGRLALWAPGVGTRHGLSSEGYPTFSADHIQAHRDRARAETGRPIGIALHGSSGLEADALRAAVLAGVVKVNWSSESLLIRSGAASTFYAQHAAQLERGHPSWKATAMDNGVQTFVSEIYIPKVSERIQVLGSAGRARECWEVLEQKTPANA